MLPLLNNTYLPRYLISSLIIVLLWSQAGYVVMQVSKAIHYRQVHYGKHTNTNKFRDTIRITPAEAGSLVWMKKDEIRYHGKMFDVKGQIRSGDHVMLVGHYDTKDDNLLAAISAFFDGGDKNHKHGKPGIGVLLFDAILPSHNIIKVYTPYTAVIQKPGFLLSRYRSSEMRAPFRPPELS